MVVGQHASGGANTVVGAVMAGLGGGGWGLGGSGRSHCRVGGGTHLLLLGHLASTHDVPYLGLNQQLVQPTYPHQNHHRGKNGCARRGVLVGGEAQVGSGQLCGQSQGVKVVGEGV